MVAGEATTAREVLDHVEATIGAGQGRVDLFSFARGSTASGVVAGAGMELAHRVGRRGALFTRGWLVAAWEPSGVREVAGEVLAGLRWQW